MFEKMQPTGRQDLEMKVFGTEKIVFENAEYAIFDTGIREYPNSDVEVWVLNFRDKRLAERIDAALIYIKPGKSTPIQSWLGERIFIEAVVQGSTTWIGVTPGGDVLSYEFNAESANSGINVYGAGYIGASVAGNEGAVILQVCNPIFKEDGTTLEAKLGAQIIGDLAIPQAFQARYESLMGLSGSDSR